MLRPFANGRLTEGMKTKIINEITGRPNMTPIHLCDMKTGKVWAKIELPTPLWKRLEKRAARVGATPDEIFRQAMDEELTHREIAA